MVRENEVWLIYIKPVVSNCFLFLIDKGVGRVCVCVCVYGEERSEELTRMYGVGLGGRQVGGRGNWLTKEEVRHNGGDHMTEPLLQHGFSMFLCSFLSDFFFCFFCFLFLFAVKKSSSPSFPSLLRTHTSLTLHSLYPPFFSRFLFGIEPTCAGCFFLLGGSLSSTAVRFCRAGEVSYAKGQSLYPLAPTTPFPSSL